MDPRSAKRALRRAALLTDELSDYGPSPPAPRGPRARGGDSRDLDTFDRIVVDSELRDTCRKLFVDGHYALAVEEAFKYINNLVKQRSGIAADGSDLMNRALSLQNPILKLGDLKTVSQRDTQLGYMLMLSGAMTGVRNPRAHQHGYLDDPQASLELLGFANHLARVMKTTRRARTRQKHPQTS